MSESRHALVVGGTGMLREASLQLARDGWQVSLIARSRDDLNVMARMAARDGGIINPMPLDYHDSASLRSAVQSAIASHGPITLVVAWIHSTAPDAPRLVAESTATTASASAPMRFVHVLGSATEDPTHGRPANRDWPARIPHLRYQRVILGFVMEGRGGGRGGASRWLTNAEICRGVALAIESARPESIVGVLEPWERHP